MLRDSISRAYLEALDRVEEIDKRLEELAVLESEKANLLHFCGISSSMLEHYGLSRSPFQRSITEGALRRVEQSDLPKQATGVMVPDDDRLWKSVHLIMALQRSPMTAQEVLTALEKQRVEVNGDHKREQVRTSILRKPELFERVGRGMFALREWSEDLRFSRTKTVVPESFDDTEDGPTEMDREEQQMVI